MRLFLIPGLFIVLAVSCSVVKQAAVQPVKVEGIAMEPALNDGDRIVISRNPDKLERGDIVIFYYPADPSKSYIKRIIGLPNEEVELSSGNVLISGSNLTESYVNPKNNQARLSSDVIKIPEDSYYVMGDNRDNSNDSRFWGPLPRKFIYGKFVSKYYAAR